MIVVFLLVFCACLCCLFIAENYFGEVDFFLVSSAFFCAITSLASCTLAVFTFGDFCMAVLEFPFVLIRVVFCAILGLKKLPPCLMIPASL